MFRGHVRHAVSASRLPSPSSHGLGRVRTVYGRGLEMPLPAPTGTGLRSTVLKVVLGVLLAVMAATRFHFEQPADASWLPAQPSGTSAAQRG